MVINKVKAKCSQCNYVARGVTRSEVLNKIRKHMWKEHADWMKKRIRKGLRARMKEQHVVGNPFLETVKKVLNPSWTGFGERPIIEKLTGRPYEQVRQETLDAFVAQVFEGIKGLTGRKGR